MKEDLYFHGIKALITNETGKVLLLQVNEDKFTTKAQQAYRDMPGGRVERGSTIEDTLQREINEEIGRHIVLNIKFLGTVLSPVRIPSENSDYGLFLSIYACSISQEHIKLSDEHISYKWCDWQEAIPLLSVKYPIDFLKSVLASS